MSGHSRPLTMSEDSNPLTMSLSKGERAADRQSGDVPQGVTRWLRVKT